MATKPSDAIAMLERDHRAVKALFSQYKQLSDRSYASKKKLANQICSELAIHTEIEEQLFYPAIRGLLKDDDLLDEAMVEHASAKELIGQIMDMDPGEDLYDAKIKVLAEQIEHHIDEEEDKMFPHVRKTKLDLEALGEQMAHFKAGLVDATA